MDQQGGLIRVLTLKDMSPQARRGSSESRRNGRKSKTCADRAVERLKAGRAGTAGHHGTTQRAKAGVEVKVELVGRTEAEGKM